MQIFNHFNCNGKQTECPVCKKNDDKPVVLIGINGTQEDGIIQAVQVHVDCVELIFTSEPSGRPPELFGNGNLGWLSAV